MLDDLTRVTRGATAERDLVTPCCGLTPFLRDYLLRCPGAPYDDCARTYGELAELVAVERKR
jgi:hypothetical protein